MRPESGKNVKAQAPFLLELVLSNRCNLDCTYCSSGFMIHEKEKKVFSFEQLRRAVDVYAACLEKNGLQGRGLVSFTGNEPLLEFELLKRVVRYIRGRRDGIRMRMDTNGTLLSPEKVKFLLDNDVRIFLSLDGCRKAHDRHRVFPGGRGSTFDVILKNIEKIPPDLRRSGGFCVWAVVTPKTAGFLPESLAFFRRLGFGAVVLCLETYGAWGPADMGRLKAALRELKAGFLRTLAGEAGADADAGTRFLIGRSEASDYRGIIGNAVSLAFDGRFYPCDFALIPPFRRECSVGSLETGIDLGRIDEIVSLPMFGRMSLCEHKAGLRSPVERYYWGLAHKYSRSRLDRELADTSRVNKVFDEEMGGYIRLREIYERLVATPSFGDFVHAPKYAGGRELKSFRLAAAAGSDPAALRAGLDFFLCSPGASKTLALAAPDGSPAALETLEALTVYALAKARLLGKRLALAREAGL